MHIQKNISRKVFFKAMTVLSLGLMTWIWYRISSFQSEQESLLEYRHGIDLPFGISYFEKYYIVRSRNSIRAFSTSCTHAGCRIVKGDENSLQCNCHGSRFEATTGKPMKGPAIKSLQEFDCQFDQKTGQWVVRLIAKV
jgi:Rieske Fe-S protein